MFAIAKQIKCQTRTTAVAEPWAELNRADNLRTATKVNETDNLHRNFTGLVYSISLQQLIKPRVFDFVCKNHNRDSSLRRTSQSCDLEQRSRHVVAPAPTSFD
ncbi:unnamed protein product [Colias eurytheme]|nr:unnamed protein product [Colias eurytheme]